MAAKALRSHLESGTARETFEYNSCLQEVYFAKARRLVIAVFFREEMGQVFIDICWAVSSQVNLYESVVPGAAQEVFREVELLAKDLLFNE